MAVNTFYTDFSFLIIMFTCCWKVNEGIVNVTFDIPEGDSRFDTKLKCRVLVTSENTFSSDG